MPSKEKLSMVEEVLFDRAQFGSPISKSRKSKKVDDGMLSDTQARTSIVGSEFSKKSVPGTTEVYSSQVASAFSSHHKRLKLETAGQMKTGGFSIQSRQGEVMPLLKLENYQIGIQSRELIKHTAISRNLQSMQQGKRNSLGTA